MQAVSHDSPLPASQGVTRFLPLLQEPVVLSCLVLAKIQNGSDF